MKNEYQPDRKQIAELKQKAANLDVELSKLEAALFEEHVANLQGDD